MGASFNYVTFEALPVADLQKQFKAYQDEETEQHGSDHYAGHIGLVNGLRFVDKTFATSNEAYDWVSENQRKYDHYCLFSGRCWIYR